MFSMFLLHETVHAFEVSVTRNRSSFQISLLHETVRFQTEGFDRQGQETEGFDSSGQLLTVDDCQKISV